MQKRQKFFLYKTGRFNAKYLSRDHTGSVDLDIEMPEVSGLEFQKQLQRNKMDIDIIYLTSHSEMMQEAFGRNVVAF